MHFKSKIIKPIAKVVTILNTYKQTNSLEIQKKVLSSLISEAKDTLFALNHDFSSISNYKKFKKNVPVRDYEALRFYVDKIVAQ